MSHAEDNPFAPRPGREFEPPVYQAKLIELPPSGGTGVAATVLYVVRWFGVALAAAVVVGVTVAGWRYFVQAVNDPPELRFLKSPENVAAGEKVKELQPQVSELRQEVSGLRKQSRTRPRAARSSAPPPEFHGAPYNEPAGLRTEQLTERLMKEEISRDEMLLFAFDRDSYIRGLVHSRLDEAELWEAAFAALEDDYHRAIAAANWIAEQTPEEERRVAVREALAKRLWLPDDKQRYPAMTAYADWAVQEDFDPLWPLLDGPIGAFIVADVCRGMACTSHPRLNEVLAKQGESRDRVEKIGRALLLDRDLTRAVIAHLAECELSLLHQRWMQTINTHAKPEDLPALEAFAERIEADVRFARQYGSVKQLIEILRRDQQRQ